MLKRVTLDSSVRGTMSANWDSPGINTFSRLEPFDQASLLRRATSAEGRRRLDELIGDEVVGEDTMSRLVVAVDRHGLEAVQAALGV